MEITHLKIRETRKNTFRLVEKKNLIIPFTHALRYCRNRSHDDLAKIYYTLKYMVEKMRNAEMYWFEVEEVDENYILIMIKDSKGLWYYNIRNPKQAI